MSASTRELFKEALYIDSGIHTFLLDWDYEEDHGYAEWLADHEKKALEKQLKDKEVEQEKKVKRI